jgi:threonine dehydrogenase-like Zn-dependent dehydrogenase
MRTAVIEREATTSVIEVPLPDPGPGEVRIAVEGCGVCGSDLPVWEGRPWFGYPRDPGAPGHEGWGRIDAVGPGVCDLSVGDRVAALGYRSYAEYDIVLAAHVVPLPAELDGQPFPGEPLACAVNAFRRSGVGSEATVAIVGCGFLGALLAGLAAHAGATVIAISRRETARRAAAAMGAHHTLALDATVLDRVGELTGGELCDVAIEAAGAQATLDLAGALTRVRGRLVIAGYHQDGPRQVDMQMWNWRGLDVINAHERDPAVYVEGMRQAVAAVASGRLDPTPLYSHRFSLDRIGDALTTMRERPDGFVKALVTP